MKTLTLIRSRLLTFMREVLSLISDILYSIYTFLSLIESIEFKVIIAISSFVVGLELLLAGGNEAGQEGFTFVVVAFVFAAKAIKQFRKDRGISHRDETVIISSIRRV